MECLAWVSERENIKMKASVTSGIVMTLIVMILGSILSPSVEASPVRDPVAVEMSAAIPAESQFPIDCILMITVTGVSAASNADLSSVLPSEMEWLATPLAWKGDIRKDDRVVLKAPVRIVADGRFSITAVVRTPGNLTTCVHSHLNFIIEGDRAEISMDPFILMDLRNARTIEERIDILSFPAETTVFITDNMPGSGGTAAWNAVITGKAQYQDFGGNAHPIRFAKVEVCDEDPDAEYASLGRGSTEADGSYSIAVSCSTPGMIPDVQVCIYSRCAFGLFTGVCPTASDPDYRLMSDVMTDCPQGNVNIDLVTGRPVMNQTNDDTAARAFSVLDAILQAALEGYCLLINDGIMLPPDYIETHFPAPSCYNDADSCIQIARNDALDWDIIHHEYYHYFTRKSAYTDFNDGPGGEHDGSSAIPDMGKDKGLRLAWDEGIASFTAVVAQLEGRAGAILGLNQPAMQGTGDTKFDNLEGSAWSWDLEIAGQSYTDSEGYGSELSVLGMLYDLWDQGQEKLPDTAVNCTDRVGLPLQTIWSLWNSGAWDDVTKFYGYISSLLMSADPNLQPLFSDLFSMNRIAPLAIQPVHNAMLSRSQIPTFTWTPNGDSTPGYPNDHFILGIFKNGLRFDQCVFVEPDLRSTTWTPTKEQWDDISENAANTTRFYWYVMAWNEKDFRTPPAVPGLGIFTSNVQDFVFRPSIYAHGMIGCPDKPATLFFDGFPLEVNPDSNEYPFHGVSAGNDYNGAPIYFILDGRFFLAQSMVRVDIAMYSDPSYSTHIRTDRAEAYAWNEWFYDMSCDLIRDTSAGCKPLWFAVRFSESQGGTGSAFVPEFDLSVDSADCPGTLALE